MMTRWTQWASTRALAEGIRRVNRAPAILLGVWTITAAVSVPATLVLRAAIAGHLGKSLAADSAASGVNYEWWQEFSDQASGVGATFRPTIIGFGAVLDNLSAFIDNQRSPLVIAGVATAYLILWLFLAGGIINRFARARRTRAHEFFAACGVFFFRFARLGVVMWLAYAALFRGLHEWLLGPSVYDRLTRDVTAERTAFAIYLLLTIVFGLLLAACNLVFDYAKVRAVVEDRRSMLGAIAASVGFIRRNAGAAAAVYAADFALFLVVIALYSLVAPGAGVSVWASFLVGQLYVIARLWVKLVFWASEAALFQGRLTHAGYVAAPKPAWPDSPMAEAINRSAGL